MALTFLKEPFFENATVNHINGKKFDNKVENLEWVTGDENHLHAAKNELKNNKLNKRMVAAIIHLSNNEVSDEVLAKAFDLSLNYIRDIKAGKRWQHLEIIQPKQLK